MATPTYSVNGTSVNGVTALWRRIPKQKKDTGVIDYQSWHSHTWDIRGEVGV
jgi:hypothetical protein